MVAMVETSHCVKYDPKHAMPISNMSKKKWVIYIRSLVVHPACRCFMDWSVPMVLDDSRSQDSKTAPGRVGKFLGTFPSRPHSSHRVASGCGDPWLFHWQFQHLPKSKCWQSALERTMILPFLARALDGHYLCQMMRRSHDTSIHSCVQTLTLHKTSLKKKKHHHIPTRRMADDPLPPSLYTCVLIFPDAFVGCFLKTICWF